MEKILANEHLDLSLRVDDHTFKIISLTNSRIETAKSNALRVTKSMSGDLNINDSAIQIRLLPSKSSKIMAFVNKSNTVNYELTEQEDQKNIKKLLFPEIMASSLKPIAKNKINNVNSGEPFWYYGNTEYEIFFSVEQKKIISFQITYNKNILSFDGENLVFGNLWEDEPKDGFSHKGAHFIKDSDNDARETIKSSSRFVLACKNIKTNYSDQIVSILNLSNLNKVMS